jgi:hypothetical protein
MIFALPRPGFGAGGGGTSIGPESRFARYDCAMPAVISPTGVFPKKGRR